MTQLHRLCLLKMLLFFLLFEPIVCPSNEQYNRRQDRSAYSSLYYNENVGNPLTANRRNFQYRPYRPQYQTQYQPQYQGQYQTQYQPQYQPQYEPQVQQYQRPLYDDSLSQQSRQYNTRQATFPYQTYNNNNDKPNKENLDIEDRIRIIFHVGTEYETQTFNTSLQNPKFKAVNDDSFNKSTDDKESTMTLSSMPTSSSSSSSLSSTQSSTSFLITSMMNNTEPTFKVQRTPDGKLSWVFTNSSLQPPSSSSNFGPPQTKQSSIGRPDIIFPEQPVRFNGCHTYEGQSLCTKVRNYPNLVHLDTILKREFSQLGLFFAEDLERPTNVSQRFGGDYEDIDPCDSEDKLIYPEAGVTKNLTWMLIVNDNSTYRQGVRVEECRGKESPCSNIINQYLPNNYKSVCVQHYIYRQLYAITDDSRVVKEHFKIPSCCKCMLRNTSKF